jgi:hypothetical protein
VPKKTSSTTAKELQPSLYDSPQDQHPRHHFHQQQQLPETLFNVHSDFSKIPNQLSFPPLQKEELMARQSYSKLDLFLQLYNDAKARHPDERVRTLQQMAQHIPSSLEQDADQILKDICSWIFQSLEGEYCGIAEIRAGLRLAFSLFNSSLPFAQLFLVKFQHSLSHAIHQTLKNKQNNFVNCRQNRA